MMVCMCLLCPKQRDSSSNECVCQMQLIDKWRASKVPEDAKIGKSMGREENERVIAQLLYDGYLQFDFSYTAYATNAYLKASQRASLILPGKSTDLSLLATEACFWK